MPRSGIIKEQKTKKAHVFKPLTRKLHFPSGVWTYHIGRNITKIQDPDNSVQYRFHNSEILFGRLDPDAWERANWKKYDQITPSHVRRVVMEEINRSETKKVKSEDIFSFSGKNRFLSNFTAAKVVLDGVEYPSVEHAYQAAKTLDPTIREEIRQASTAGVAKKAGKGLVIRDDWDKVRISVMKDLLTQKFAPGSDLGYMLLATGNGKLVEGNYWGDTFWGICKGQGENNLGKLLMDIRKKLALHWKTENAERCELIRSRWTTAWTEETAKRFEELQERAGKYRSALMGPEDMKLEEIDARMDALLARIMECPNKDES